MGLLDFFKKKKKKEIHPVKSRKAGISPKAKLFDKGKEKVEKRKTKKRPLEKKEEIIKPEIKKPKKKISERAYQVLRSPHITEKATMLEKENKYVFKVRPKTNKTEIKRAVEDIYGVDAIGVKIIKIPKKRRRLGRQTGWRKGYKKAIVKIKEGQKIEILSR